MKNLLIFVLVWTLSCSVGFAQAANPYSTGTGKRVAGTILIPAGSAVGGLFYLIGAFSSGVTCDRDDIEGTDDTARYDKSKCTRDRIYTYGGLGMIVFSVGYGIYLIRAGRHDRVKWQQWEDKHRAKHSFDLHILDEGPALAYQYKF